MFTVERQIEIDAGHRVPYHDSQCRFLHGHRWRIVAQVSAPELVAPHNGRSDSGMVVDFGTIKRVLMDKIHAHFDHRFILWDRDPLLETTDLFRVLDSVAIASGLVQVPCIPTSEELARYWAREIELELSSANFTLTALKVWETPNCVATYTPERFLRNREEVEQP